MEEFKNVSIRGRFAFAMLCFENSLPMDIEVRPALLQKVIDIAWTFTTSNRLDIWHGEMDDFDPYVLEKEFPDLEPEFISKEDAHEFYNILMELPEVCSQLLTDTFWLGKCGLYGAFESANLCSLEYLERIIAIVEANEISKPSLGNILKTKPEEDPSQWGGSHPREWYIAS